MFPATARALQQAHLTLAASAEQQEGLRCLRLQTNLHEVIKIFFPQEERKISFASFPWPFFPSLAIALSKVGGHETEGCSETRQGDSYLTATAKSLQSCPTLCDPIDGSLPGSSVHGIFQARVPEWGAIAFSAYRSCQKAWTVCPKADAFPQMHFHGFFQVSPQSSFWLQLHRQGQFVLLLAFWLSLKRLTVGASLPF